MNKVLLTRGPPPPFADPDGAGVDRIEPIEVMGREVIPAARSQRAVLVRDDLGRRIRET